MQSLIKSFILFTLLVNICLAKLPSDIQLCKANDSDCISKVATGIIHGNPNGRSDLALPKIDPFRVNKLVINEGQTGALNLALSFHDIDVEGLSKLKADRITGFTKDPNTQFELYGGVPNLRLKGKYKANGRILVLPIQGEGNADINLSNVKASIKIKPTVSQRDGHTYVKIDKIKLLLEPSKMTIKLDGLFNNDKTLGDNMNTFLNENWSDVWTELSPSINTACAEILRSLINPFFQKYPYDEIYSD